MRPRPRLLSSSINVHVSIPEEFNNIAGFDLPKRQVNYLFDRIERKDPVFSGLARLYCFSPRRFNKLKFKIRSWIKKMPGEETFALAGYIYYISNNFKKAKHCFLRTIALSPDNLDNWIDLAFCLRHNGEDVISNGILFNYQQVSYYYKYLGLAGRGYASLKRLVLEVVKNTDAA